MRARVALLWHMHQPMYVDPATGEAILPWVRLHATHAYYDMGRMLERHPTIRATVNFVPSLVEQLELAASGGLKERYLEASQARPAAMTRDQRAFVVRQFFMADRYRCIRPFPRYQQLLDRRGEDPGAIDVGAFDDQDLLDIQVLFNLTWMGFAARRDEPDVAKLVEKGGNFDEDDKARLLAAQQRIVQAIIPLWRRLAATGRIELSTTPYYHPILPLLCDSDSARRAMPHAKLPPRFHHEDDAREQVRMALAKHESAFGERPSGMWPAEGSVSPEAVAVLASEGIRWIATDEGNLFRSTPAPTRHGDLYQAWSTAAGSGSLAVAFRDRAISDRIGFNYASQPATDAVGDFLGHLRRASSEGRQVGLAQPLIPVVLDGENAWERYPHHGEEFLDRLYTRLANDHDFETVTMRDGLAHPTARISQIHSGSWIDSNYRIWIGHPEDNLGWELLGQVRALLDKHAAAGDVPPDRLQRARQLLLSAEGSDWFWWYGDDFDTDNAAEFDSLFRDRLTRAASLLGETPPRRLAEPISAKAKQQRSGHGEYQLPSALISPRVDGRGESFAEWLGAGTVRPRGGHGAMYRSEHAVRGLYFGCDLEHLYFRLDPAAPLPLGSLTIEIENGLGGRKTIEIPTGTPGALPVPLEGGRGQSGEVYEVALPLAEIALAPGDHARFALLLRSADAELQRLPAAGTITFDVPDADFDRRHWLV